MLISIAAQKAAAARLPFTTPPSHDAIDVFDRPALLELRRAARLQSIFKTSFSRSNPGPRGQATAIRSSVRSTRRCQQQTTQSDKLPSYLQPLHQIRPARSSLVSTELGSDIRVKTPTPGSLQINLLFTIFAEQACASAKRCKLLLLQKTSVANSE